MKIARTQRGVVLKTLGAVALGVGAALVTVKVVRRLSNSAKNTRAALRTRLSAADHESIARMEGEGGSSRPVLPTPSAPAMPDDSHH